MTNQNLKNLVTTYDSVVVWGHSAIGDYLYDFLTREIRDKKTILVDNDSSKQQEYKGQMVISLERALQQYAGAVFIITSFTNKNVMKKILIEQGVSETRVIYGVTEESLEYEREQLKEQKFKRLNELQFEVDLAMHCNLDCNCCSQFAPLAEPEFASLNQMKKDFERLGNLFNGRAKRIYLIGGEPLLNEDICACMEIARKSFPSTEISIFSNGLLLKKMHDQFWEICRKNNISIIVTRYPINFDYDKIQKYVLSKNIVFQFAGTSQDYKYMSNIGIDVEGKQNPEDSFIHCYEANNCIKLRNGRLYTCTRPATIYKFNQFFGEKLEVSDYDYINIYDTDNAEEILEFLSHPIPFCRYCNQAEHRIAREWGHSTKKIDEWT